MITLSSVSRRFSYIGLFSSRTLGSGNKNSSLFSKPSCAFIRRQSAVDNSPVSYLGSLGWSSSISTLQRSAITRVLVNASGISANNSAIS